MIATVVLHCILPGHGIRLCAHGLQSLVLSKTLLAVALAVYDPPGGIHSDAGYLILDHLCYLPVLAVASYDPPGDVHSNAGHLILDGLCYLPVLAVASCRSAVGH